MLFHALTPILMKSGGILIDPQDDTLLLADRSQFRRRLHCPFTNANGHANASQIGMN